MQVSQDHSAPPKEVEEEDGEVVRKRLRGGAGEGGGGQEWREVEEGGRERAWKKSERRSPHRGGQGVRLQYEMQLLMKRQQQVDLLKNWLYSHFRCYRYRSVPQR